MKIIAWFNELSKRDVSIAGGKGTNLGELTNAGFPVPMGFVVTAQAYQEFLEKTGIDKEIYDILSTLNVDDNDALQKASKQIKVIITSEEVPYQVKQEITKAYDNLMIGPNYNGLNKKTLELVSASRPKEPFVAVRSSATAEDMPDTSFAGQQESFLNVKGSEGVIRAVKDCWASLFTARSIFYRVKNNLKHETVLIAVIIQKMVDSEKSGVAFSIHPASGNKNEIIIEAGWGLGEYIVKGIINPDNYIIDKETISIKNKLIKKQIKMLTRDPISGKNIEVEIPDQKREKQVLDDVQIIGLARVVKKIEEHYGMPQDVEWASENNRLFIVQTRPVTFFGKGEVKETESSGNSLVKGLNASPGKASGKVVIIHDSSELDKIKKGDIMVTEMTNPDMVPAMERAGAIITNEGGLTSHAAIVSRELGVPCIVGTGDATTKLKDGMIITVDANNGLVTEGGMTIEQQPVKVEPIARKDYSAPVTGTKIYMNLGIPEKIDDYAELPFDGIGLMRIEFIIASHIKKHPLQAIKDGQSNDFINKLADGIATVAGRVKPRPVIVRFSDFKTNEYADLEGGKAFEPEESNPMIGWRGCSRYVSPDFEPAFRLECKAIKKVRDAGLKNVWVMLPFVRTVKEVIRVQEIMSSEGLIRGEDFKVLLMAEVPSIMILADQFSKICDGFSIGSNDLTQLTLGVDRDSSKLGMMGYFNERDESVKESIKWLIKCAHDNGVKVGICGQAPSEYPDFTEFLIESGIDSVSVNPDTVYATKDLVSSVEKRILLRLAREGEPVRDDLKEEVEAHVEPAITKSPIDSFNESAITPDPIDSFRIESNDPRDHEEKGMFWP
ncbi:MAG: phosphoenolpyruvate synthase [Candidatus Nanoarchaeia archaeon]|jgi:pyruvate,water dikinase